jgi:FkbM family methyltransferase
MTLTFKNLVKQVLPQMACEYSIRRNTYLRLGLNSSGATWKAFSSRRYHALCDARLNLLPNEITSALRTCVDAGAHRGSWTQALIEVFEPEQVIAVECEPRLVEQLTKDLAFDPRVRVVDAALAGSNGSATFYQLRHPAGSSLLKPNATIGKEFEADSWNVIGEARVKKIGYDDLVKDESEISVLKLDIQGAEREVLENSEEGLRKTKSVIMEVFFTPHYEKDAVFPELHELMARKNFGLYRLSPAYDRGGRSLFADAVYVREEILDTLSPRS